MTSSKSSTKIFTNSGKNCYESSRTDSGFLSGANLMSDENLSSDELCTTDKSLSSFDVQKNTDIENSMQIDSGVDVGLNEQFSGLSLDQKLGVKDLIQIAKSRHLVNSCVSKPNQINSKLKETKSSGIVITQPWELYFQQDEEGDTQLHIAIIQGFIEVVYSLIKMVPHPCFLDILNDVVQSPLHLAVLTHQSRIVRQLVVAGASVEVRDRHGNTPLHLACQMGDVECVKSLTDPISVTEINNANLLYTGYIQQVPQDFEERNYEGETCLHLAAYGGHIDILRHLIWFGADINARENKSGRTILHYAVETLNHRLLRFLLDECPLGPRGLTIDMQNYAGHTAYQLARILDAKVASDLVNRGADRRVEDIDEDDEEHPDHNAEEDSMEEREVIMKSSPMVGGAQPLPLDHPEVTEARDLVIMKLNENRREGEEGVELLEVISATQQVVSGTLMRLTLHVRDGTVKKKCVSTIWSQPWLGDPKVEILEFVEIGSC